MTDWGDILVPGGIRARRGPTPSGRAFLPKERKQRFRETRKRRRLQHLAVLDFETDPFEDEHGEIYPFVCEIYSDQFAPIVIWDDDYNSLIDNVYDAITSLPDEYIIYAHNGGRFDFMFFVHKLRGLIKFKGRAIMSAKIGKHELRDSFHILPEKLAVWKKDTFDYSKMSRRNRHRFKNEILIYLHSDCVYLFDFIRRFTKEFGLKISIGQAAFTELKKHYKIAGISEAMDAALRPYFLGGRVECIAGQGLFESARFPKPYRLYDVNSMYPFVMATQKHPVSPEYIWHRGPPTEHTFFIDLECQNHGAFFRHTDDGELIADEFTGQFFTTIWEYQAALELRLIENVKINWCVDNWQATDFAGFIIPMYNRRQECKTIMRRLKAEGKEATPEYEEIKKEDIFLKYLLNNSYGKCAQNPRRFKEYYYADRGEKPPGEWFAFMNGADDETRHKFSFPIERAEKFDVWARPSPGWRFNNVGTAASITGAARATLLRAKESAIDPLYCDTDSLIARDLPGTIIDPVQLGAWDLEQTFDAVIVAGKKTYACKVAGQPDCAESRLKVRSKGVDLRKRPASASPTPQEWAHANAETWQRFLDLLDGKTVVTINRAPTFSKTGQQGYLTRRIRATAPLKSVNRREVFNGDCAISA